MEMDFPCSAGDCGNARICCHWRRNSATPVELAAAAALRLTWMAPFQSSQFPPSHERPLRAHDARRAATIPAAHARTLGLWAIDQREQGAMKLKCQVPRVSPILRDLGMVSSYIR